MKLYIKQKMFSFLDSFDVFDENGEPYYHIKGQFAMGHSYAIYDRNGEKVGSLVQKVLTFMPTFYFYNQFDEYVGCVKQEPAFFKWKFNVNFNNLEIDGDAFGFNLVITQNNSQVATVKKILWQLTDTYEIDTLPQFAVSAILVTLAYDGIRAQRN
ncbi:MAG: LURP-one-related family protein [Bacilli bacterium]|nr:LURP-one-related family protein [Bacilli bacterium]